MEVRQFASSFPRWTNWLPLKIAVCGFFIVLGLTAATWYYVTPKYTRVGYEPIQPVPFQHSVHVEQLGMDCRYCHSFVEVAAHSNLPTTQTCMADYPSSPETRRAVQCSKEPSYSLL